MRSLSVAIAIFLLAFGLACVVELPDFARPEPAQVRSTFGWRRTADGWEDSSSWPTRDDRDSSFSRLHPALVASFQMLVSLGSLLAFERNTRNPVNAA